MKVTETEKRRSHCCWSVQTMETSVDLLLKLPLGQDIGMDRVNLQTQHCPGLKSVPTLMSFVHLQVRVNVENSILLTHT